MYNISNKPSYARPASTKKDGQSSNPKTSHSTWLSKIFSILLLLMLLSSCEDSEPVFFSNDIEVKYRVFGGIVMEDVVMRITTAPNESIERVEVHQFQEVIEIFDGSDESTAELFVGNLSNGTYLVKVYSPTSELFTKEVIIE